MQSLLLVCNGPNLDLLESVSLSPCVLVPLLDFNTKRERNNGWREGGEGGRYDQSRGVCVAGELLCMSVSESETERGREKEWERERDRVGEGERQNGGGESKKERDR